MAVAAVNRDQIRNVILDLTPDETVGLLLLLGRLSTKVRLELVSECAALKDDHTKTLAGETLGGVYHALLDALKGTELYPYKYGDRLDTETW